MITEAALKQHLADGLTIWQIMKAENVSRNTIRNWMAKYTLATPKGFFSRGLRQGRPPGIPMSEDQKALRRRTFVGSGNPFHGKTHSASTRKRMAENHADFGGENNPYKKWIGDPKNRNVRARRRLKYWRALDAKCAERFAQQPKLPCCVTGTFWSHICTAARARNIAVEITKEDAWQVFVAQEGRCALSGEIIGFSSEYSTASLDRVDSTRGYTKNNIQWVHKAINIMKNDLIQDDFIYFCKRVAQCQGN